MNALRWLVHSRIWVALAAAAWSVESFVRYGEWTRLTLVAHIFFLTWSAYLFISDDAIRKNRALVLFALTGVCVTFQGFEASVIPLLSGATALCYRTHWMPSSWGLSRFEFRSVPILNNALIAFCWVSLCMVWPMHRCGVNFSDEIPFLIAAFCWITALSMSEDLFVESTPDASLRLLGRSRLRMLSVALIVVSMGISYCFHEQQRSVWISMIASLLLLILMPGGKRTVGKSWLIDAMIVLRYPFF